jgi:hypothetical protein
VSVHIKDYSFGMLEIDGKKYTEDLIIYPDGSIDDHWWRQEGHILMACDIAGLLDTHPEVLVVGMGFEGQMNPESGLREEVKDRGIEMHALNNSEAIPFFNEIAFERKTGACFHVTC